MPLLDSLGVDYQIGQLIYHSQRTSVFRGVAPSGTPVILKTPTDLNPTAREIARYQWAYDVARDTNPEAVVRHLAIERVGASVAIVLEDLGGAVLSELIPTGGLPVSRWLSIASGLAGALTQLHASGIIHRDVKPGNALITADGSVRLLDLGIAMRTRRGSAEIIEGDQIEGTLAYMSPEQCGRIRAPVDGRSDLYSLGVTLFEMATGRVPFPFESRAEVAHAHVARHPTSIRDVVSAYPPVLAEIVDRLLAKNPADRYATARGLLYDLERCSAEVQRSGTVRAFELGQIDTDLVFRIPDRLYGRDSERAQLLEAVSVARNGERVLVTVSGASGVGKTALVNNFARHLDPTTIRMCSGKFDQFRTELPYLGLVQALQMLVRQELAEPDEHLRARRNTCTDAVGSYGRLLTDLIPEVQTLVGPQPTVEQPPPQEAALRLQVVFGNFLACFATRDQPLLILLDDMQWAEPATLQLIEAFGSHPGLNHLVLVLGYRSNEVGPAHPLLNSMASLQRSVNRHTDVVLRPLRADDVAALIGDTLHARPEQVAPLARLVYEVAGGNPFFVDEYLLALHDRRCFEFDDQSRTWQWSLDDVRTISLPDTAAALVTERLDALPLSCLDLLDTASCVGGEFDLQTIVTVHGRKPADVAAALQPAVSGGVIVSLDDLHRIFGSLNEWTISEDEAESLGIARYRFQHDRVREAVHERLDDERRSSRHAEIGQLLLRNLPSEELDRRAVEVFTHAMYGIALIGDSDERADLARLGLAAGRQAQRALGFDSAWRMLLVAQTLLAAEAWTSDYPTALGINMALAECAFALERYDELEGQADVVITNAHTAAERADAHGLRIRARHLQQRDTQAIDIGVEVAASLGVRLPREPRLPSVGISVARSLWAQRGRDPMSFLSLAECDDDEIRASVSLLTSVANAAYFKEPNLLALIGMTTTRLAIRNGATPQTPYGFAVWGLVLCGALGRIDTGYGFGQLALEVGRRYGGTEEARARFVVDCFIRHWKEPLSEVARLMHDDWARSRDAGDAESATYCAGVAVYSHFLAGGSIDVHERYAEPIRYLETSEHVMVKDCFLSWVDLLAALRGSEAPEELIGEHVSYPELSNTLLRLNSSVQICISAISAGVLDHLAGRFQRAEERFSLAARWDDGIVSQVLVPGLVFFRARNAYRLAQRGEGRPSNRAMLAVARRSHGRLRRWAPFAPMNLAHRLALLDAEAAFTDGKTGDGIVALHRAIHHANDSGGVLYEALAHQRLAEVLRDTGAVPSASAAAAASSVSFARWGSPWLAEAVSGQSLSSTARATSSAGTTSGTGGLGDIDAESLFAAVAAMSSEIDEGALLARLMPTLMQAAGATRGLLLLESDGELWVEAEAQLGEVAVRRMPLDAGTVLSRRTLAVAQNSAAPAVVHDAATSELLAGDDDLDASGLMSILAVPITPRGRQLGVLYLENNVARGAFTESRVEVTRALSTQAGIAIENARLYGQVREALEVQTALTEANRRFVPQGFVSGLGMESITDAKLNVAIEREMNVLFVDIRSFTPLTLELGPKNTVAMLNRYLSHVQPSIAVHGGFVGLYTGDGLLALFPDHADGALNASFAMCRGLEGYNSERGDAFPELSVGMGMHSGLVTMGTIGDPDHFQCGVFGDTVNVASRLEGLTKHFAAPMVISEATYGRLSSPHDFLLRPLGRVVVVGHTDPIQVYEGTGCHPEAVQQRLQQMLPTYVEALDNFCQGRFATARDAFSECVSACSEDTVAAAFAQRCANRPDGAWDGVERPGKS